jgi:hypothetical protein
LNRSSHTRNGFRNNRINSGHPWETQFGNSSETNSPSTTSCPFRNASQYNGSFRKDLAEGKEVFFFECETRVNFIGKDNPVVFFEIFGEFF